MAVVPVTGFVTDFAGDAISGVQARLFFRANKPVLGDLGLQVRARWVEATLSDPTGYFTVYLDNTPGVFYTPVLQYLNDGTAPDPSGFEEWINVRVFPGPVGGPITSLIAADLTIYTVLVSVDDPPVGYTGWWLHAGVGDPDDEEETGTGELRRVEGWTS